MNSSKAIDISKSSLVGLKAELSRKQDEVEKAKSLRPAISGAAPNRISKTYPSDKRKRKTKGHEDEDDELKDDKIDEDVEALDRSRHVLEVKSKLYRHLEEGRSVTDPDKPDYLVNFHQKRLHDSKQSPSVDGQEEEEEEDNYSLGDSGSENEWVDFEDALGRSRRCLRKDLRLMKEKDEHLANSLKPESARPSESGKEEEEGRERDAFLGEAELVSSDMHHQMMRSKWEEQERKLLDKTDVHYQDLLFDEARTHGVGYYKFSTEEEERSRQQDELSRLRQETVRRQGEAQGLRERRNRQLQARLNAAKLRKRQRLGLPSPPPQQPAPSEAETGTVIPGEGAGDTKRLDDIERELKRAAHVRPWDLGKDGVAAAPVMTQEEWVEQKRKERLNEFAPPSLYDEQQQTCGRAKRQTSGGLFFTSKKLCKSTPQSSSAAESPSLTDLNHKIQKSHDVKYSSESLLLRHMSSREDRQSGAHITGGVEIPPPLTMEYYGGTTKRLTEDHLSKGGETKRMRDSIEEGIGYLRKQKEMDQKKREKGLLDII